MAPDVESWLITARTLQADIQKSRVLASNIVRQAEEEEERRRSLDENETHLAFLQREYLFSNALVETLHSFKQISDRLDKVEALAGDGQIMRPLHILEGKREKFCRSIFAVSDNARIMEYTLEDPSRCNNTRSSTYRS